MAHELSIRKDGQVEMFYVGDAPWHKLGVHVEKAPTIAEAIKAAGLNWSVITKPLFTAMDQEVNLTDRKAPALATVRSDTGAILGVVGPQYKVLQNSEAFNFFQPFLDSGLVTLETAGALKGGKRIWVMAKIKGHEAEAIQGDKIEQYILLSNSHDGSLAIRVGFTPVRVVCNNTLHRSHNNKSSKLIRIKHQGNPQEALQMVQEAMNVAKAEFEATVDQYRKMAKTEINRQDMEKYIRIVFDLKTEDESNRSSKVVESVLKLVENGRGSDLPGVKGTLWGLYNAATEYIQYERGRSEDSRLDSTWFGTGAAINKKAFETAMVMVKA